jgi:hypothetical protein
MLSQVYSISTTPVRSCITLKCRMIVKLRFHSGPRIRREGVRNRRAALTASALLTPFSVLAFALGGWRVAADLAWTSSFAIPAGPLSHWQVWLALSFILQVAATLLNRYAETGEE